MMHRAEITVHGKVGTEPVLRTAASGKPWVAFRLVATPRFRGEDGQYRDGATSWFTVKVWREHLAANVGYSLHHGMNVVVQGRVVVESWTGEQGQRFDHVIRADVVAVDLSEGQVQYVRTRAAAPAREPAIAAADGSRWETADADEPGENDGAPPPPEGYPGAAAGYADGGAYPQDDGDGDGGDLDDAPDPDAGELAGVAVTR